LPIQTTKIFYNFSKCTCFSPLWKRFRHPWSQPNPSCVICSWFVCDWWLLPTFVHVA